MIVLTTGDRAEQLQAAVHSSLQQADVNVEVIVVSNGVADAGQLGLAVDERVRVITSAENLGIPGGRNLGTSHAGGRLVAFLDDDARFTDPGALARAAAAFDADPGLGVIALRIVDENGNTARRHVPRIGSRRPEHDGKVTSFLGGAAVIRRGAFDAVGGYAESFFYSMEETDLALRLIDHGWAISYVGTPAVFHPRTDPSRHPDAAEHTMRNRVWLAYRNLPVPLAAGYIVNWFAISAARRPRDLTVLARGAREGWRSRPRRERAPISWRTIGQLTRLGRPPIV